MPSGTSPSDPPVPPRPGLPQRVRAEAELLAWRAKYFLTLRARELLQAVARPLGRDCLTRDGSARLLDSLGMRYEVGEIAELSLGPGIHKLEVRPSGTVRVNGRHILNTDLGNRMALIDRVRKRARVERAIALWSHPFKGYYHWTIEVLPKICACLERWGPGLGGRTLVFPRSYRAYEKEGLALLGISEEQTLDTTPGLNVEADSIAIVPAPNWFRPIPNLDLLRKRLLPHAEGDGPRRLYLSRTGLPRRTCPNERELWDLLQPLGFTLIPEQARTVRQQIGLFRNAEMILSLHGSAMTNIVWSPRDALVIELASRRYAPEYFPNLTRSLGQRYHQVLSGAGKHHKTAVIADVEADIPALRSYFESLEPFARKPGSGGQ